MARVGACSSLGDVLMNVRVWGVEVFKLGAFLHNDIVFKDGLVSNNLDFNGAFEFGSTSISAVLSGGSPPVLPSKVSCWSLELEVGSRRRGVL